MACLFFVSLLWGTNSKASQFASMALANLSNRESHRQEIREGGGLPALVGVLMSADPEAQKFAAMALTNMALSATSTLAIFESIGLWQRIIKLAKTDDVEIKKEMISLLCLLSCHTPLAKVLVESRTDFDAAISVLRKNRKSVQAVVKRWAGVASAHFVSLRQHMQTGQALSDYKNSSPALFLASFRPLASLVLWKSWGSRLDRLDLLQNNPPHAQGQLLRAIPQQPLKVCLRGTVSKQSGSSDRGLEYVVVQYPGHGILFPHGSDGNIHTYVPEEDYTGSDFFTFKVTNGLMESNVATVAITVSFMDDDTTLVENPLAAAARAKPIKKA